MQKQEYSSVDEYRKAFYPKSAGESEASADPAEFGARVADEVLKKAMDRATKADSLRASPAKETDQDPTGARTKKQGQ